ncbi:MAG: selenocysteine-specific translation elongation factor [Ruthenibacterium sp.]
MNHIIIGTAGHVDHGKTCLIQALTGVDTDRLAEEKKRGITIELGFAALTLDDGRQVGIVDVPGHERFIKNMLAGAGGIDLAMLVVAADEGFMPQTREHLSILSLLGVHHGVVVLTKTDLVDDDWRAMVCEEIRGETAGTFLEDAPVLPVCARTGEGIAALRAALTALACTVEEKDLTRPFRLPVDRVFSVDGFGTVVTGTLIDGDVRVGDAVQLYPGDESAKVRNLQVHGADTPEAFAGQRVAMNLAGAKKEKLLRGDTVAAPGSMQTTRLMDVWLDVVKECTHPITHGLRLHLYHGARTVLCRLVLPGCDSIAPGTGAPAQLRLDEPLCCREGDRFVVRFFSPLETVGGGVILESGTRPLRHSDAAAAASLACKAHGTPAEKLALLLQEHTLACMNVCECALRLRLSFPQTQTLLDACPDAVSADHPSGKIWLHRAVLDQLAKRGGALLKAYHAANPLAPGMPREEFRAKLSGTATPVQDAVLNALLAQNDELICTQGIVKRKDFGVYYTKAQQKLRDALCAAFEQGGFAPPENDALNALFPREREALKQMLRALCEEGWLVLVSPQFYMSGACVQRAQEIFAQLQAKGGAVALGDFRDALGSSRKYALPLLEYFDRRGITVKSGDLRTLKE